MRTLILLLLISNFAWAQQRQQAKYGINEFMLIHTVEDQEKRYNEALKEPAENLQPTALNDFRAELAFAWLAKGNAERALHYMETNPRYAARQSLYLIAELEKLFDKGKNYAAVSKISKFMLDGIEKSTFADAMGRKTIIMQLNAASNAKLGNIEQAKRMIALAGADKTRSAEGMNYFKDMKSNYLNRYGIVMNAAGQHQTAFDTLSQAFRDADSNPYMVATLKEAYAKVKGSDKGFDQYLKSLTDDAYQRYRKEVEQSYVATAQQTLDGIMVSPSGDGSTLTTFKAEKPLTEVSMLDLNGNTVRLGAHKGKILVIDFWTTLCTPCVAAFAGFERVVADYKKDELQLYVVNLFETNSTVKAYVAQKGVVLDVLQDEENLGYDVRATPTKIVFDPMGNIRFYASGYAGSTDREYYKLKAMVEITKAGAVGTKTSKAE